MKLNLQKLEQYKGKIFKEKIQCRNKTLSFEEFDFNVDAYKHHLQERKRKLDSAYIKSVEKDMTIVMKNARKNKNKYQYN
jgi:hypothetical protein